MLGVRNLNSSNPSRNHTLSWLMKIVDSRNYKSNMLREQTSQLSSYVSTPNFSTSALPRPNLLKGLTKHPRPLKTIPNPKESYIAGSRKAFTLKPQPRHPEPPELFFYVETSIIRGGLGFRGYRVLGFRV